MTLHTRIKILSASVAAIALGACSGGYDDYYDESYYGGQDAYYSGGQSGYGQGYSQAGYNQARYGMTGGGGSGGGCVNPYGGGMYNYGGGTTSGGLRYGGSYGAETGGVSGGYSGKKSRYGSWQQSAGGAGCATGGYWIPTYQIVQTPAPTPAPVVTATPAVTVQASCPDGQYRMDNGDCAIMMTEETEQYVPPVTGYPVNEHPVDNWYEPIRK